MKTTTVRIYPEELFWIQKAMRILGIKSVAGFLKEWHDKVLLGQQKEWYNKLPQAGEKKPLKGKCIPKTGTTYG